MDMQAHACISLVNAHASPKCMHMKFACVSHVQHVYWSRRPHTSPSTAPLLCCMHASQALEVASLIADKRRLDADKLNLKARLKDVTGLAGTLQVRCMTFMSLSSLWHSCVITCTSAVAMLAHL